MKNVATSASQLAVAYELQVTVANNVERASLNTVYPVRKYLFTADANVYAEGEKTLAHVGENLKKQPILLKNKKS
ncbi:MAG: hypothetical protein IT292_09305 [Deltaproteobacteria bacterium]|nr:hypothetical protein [Deltaproteobacteria bacterium]